MNDPRQAESNVNLLAMAHAEQLAEYDKDDPNRTRFSLHNLIANVMSIARDKEIDLVDLITEGVDLYEQRGDDLPGGNPRAFFRLCHQSAR